MDGEDGKRSRCYERCLEFLMNIRYSAVEWISTLRLAMIQIYFRMVKNTDAVSIQVMNSPLFNSNSCLSSLVHSTNIIVRHKSCEAQISGARTATGSNIVIANPAIRPTNIVGIKMPLFRLAEDVPQVVLIPGTDLIIANKRLERNDLAAMFQVEEEHLQLIIKLRSKSLVVDQDDIGLFKDFLRRFVFQEITLLQAYLARFDTP